MQEQALRIADPRTEANRLGRQLNLPPGYLLIHRVSIGSIGVLCQLDAAADWRAILAARDPLDSASQGRDLGRKGQASWPNAI